MQPGTRSLFVYGCESDLSAGACRDRQKGRTLSPLFQELDYRPTPIGALSLRRRKHMATGDDVYEIILGDAFLMSSLFTVAEEELSNLGLAATEGDELDVAVGGLGLGYTAKAALDCARVRSLVVVEALEAVIDWHEEGLLPVGRELTADGRCRFRQGDFFELVDKGHGLDQARPDGRFHAILVDIDHSPSNVLDPTNVAFYQPEGLRKLAAMLHAGGVFALWSNDPPDEAFEASLRTVFSAVESHVVPFKSPFNDTEETNTVYVARL